MSGNVVAQSLRFGVGIHACIVPQRGKVCRLSPKSKDGLTAIQGWIILLFVETNLYEFVKAGMQALPRPEWSAIAAESGVPYGTVYRYAHGYVTRPTHEPLVKIAAALKARTP